MNTELIEAIDMLEKEKGIPKETLFEAMEAAMVSAYKKNYNMKDSEVDVDVQIDRETGEIEITGHLEVVPDEELMDVSSQIAVSEAQEFDPEFKVGDILNVPVDPSEEFGRVAAQTAKQVIVQRIREAERGKVYNDFIERVGDTMRGKIERMRNDTVYVRINGTEGVLSAKEQVKGERYRPGDYMDFYIMDVKDSTKGPQVFLSRSHPGLVKRLFEQEVPEIEDGIVEIRSIAREAGSRTKIAVYTEDENVDPVGACVGSRGSRVQTIVDELGSEKIDIITWSDDPVELIGNVLSPAKVEQVGLDEEEKIATVIVPDYQLSLAIGKSGQNVRLAAKLCGWKIDIKSHTQYFGDDEEIEDEYDDFDDEVIEEEFEEAETEANDEEAAEEAADEEETIEAEAADEEEAIEAEAETAEEEAIEAEAEASDEDVAEEAAETEEV